MQKRARRAHGIRSRKISVSVSTADLKVLSARARRLHRGNLSAVVHELVAALQREEAAEEVLAILGGDRITEEEMQAIGQEIAQAGSRRRRRPAA
jgi:hypothetical protein